MWEGLIARLRGHPKAPPPLPQPDEQLALGALLVRVAMADHDYAAVEIGEIDHVLSVSFGLNPVAAAKMRATCEKLEHAAPGTPEFARLIRETVTHPRRLEMLTGLWIVAMADGRRAREEEDELARLRDALGLDETDSAEAKARALRALAE